ncbi:MAG: hypothetical protein K2F87_06640 [Muribaculaceae bacterium]|nr:hypothetical protein [Muribaculaceae bacterium]
MLTIVIMCAMMCAAGYFFLPPNPSPADFGIVFPSPDRWQIPPLWAEAINVAVIALCAPLAYLINKTFSLLKSPQPVWALFYLPLTCCNLQVSGQLTATAITLPVTLILFTVLFSSYRAVNATQPIFFCATCISVGSMFQQAFIPFIIALFISGIVMNIMRIKELLALGLGLLAPYWVLIGFGVIGLGQFHAPHFSTVFTSVIGPRLTPVLTGGTMLLTVALLLALNNGMKLYAGNAQIRSYNNVVNVFGLTAVVAMLFDIDNINAYVGVFNLWVALQFGNLFTLWHLHKAIWIFWLIQLCILVYTVILLITP